MRSWSLRRPDIEKSVAQSDRNDIRDANIALSSPSPCPLPEGEGKRFSRTGTHFT